MSIKNDGHYFCRAGGNRPDGLNEPVTDNVKYRVIINNLYGSEFRIRDINENFVGMDFTCEF
nr:hypothetical protein [Escherichia coli]